MQGKTINGFELKRQLGVGGMAEVWYAENEIGMKAAVKIMSDELSRNAQMRERFLNEAKVMVKLDHTNIRKVYGYGEIDGRPAIIMEYLDGMDLKAMLRRGRCFSDEELKKWWNQLVSALNYTHAHNIVHRDIKPSNIFLDRKGDVKLLDFGIAKVADTTSGTQTGSTLGTRIYMSPEQVKDPKRVGPKSDVYSLAVSFVHLLTGKAPYDSTTTSDYDIQVSIVTKPVDLSLLPEAWHGFLAPYLEKEPDERPCLKPFEATVPMLPPMDEDEETVAGGSNRPSEQPSGAAIAKPVPIPQPQPKQLKNKRKGLWIGVSVAVAVALLLLLLLKPRKETVQIDPDTAAYQACQTADDYRNYITEYGRNADHYLEATAFIEQYEADSIAKEQQLLAQKKEAEAKAKADNEKKRKETEAKANAEKAKKEKEEDLAFENCTTMKACDEYLNKYPKGRYVEQVKNKRIELMEFYQSGLDDVQEEEIFTIVEEMASFPGGNAELGRFLSQNIKYPKDAREAGIQGKVLVSFMVESDGSISNVELVRGIGGGCDEEAMRVVKLMPKWKPGKQRGKPVRVTNVLPINFKLQ